MLFKLRPYGLSTSGLILKSHILLDQRSQTVVPVPLGVPEILSRGTINPNSYTYCIN
jgi:hypothetical protein